MHDTFLIGTAVPMKRNDSCTRKLVFPIKALEFPQMLLREIIAQSRLRLYNINQNGLTDKKEPFECKFEKTVHNRAKRYKSESYI